MRTAAPLYTWFFVGLLTSLLLTAGGRLAPMDDETTYEMTANFVEYGRLTIDRGAFEPALQTSPGFLPRTTMWASPATWAVPGRDGQLYPQYAPGLALAVLPLYLIGRLIGGAPSIGAVLITRLTTALFNPIVIALTAYLIARLARRLGLSVRWSLLLGAAYATGSLAWAYTGTLYSEPFLALLLVLAVYALVGAKTDRADADRQLLIAGAALGFMLITRERSAIWLPAFLLYALPINRRRWRGWLWLLAPLIAAGVLLGLINWSRYGSPLTFGYSSLQNYTFEAPLWLGLYGLLISPGKGLLLYAPIVGAGIAGLLSMWRRQRAEGLLFTLISVTQIGFFAMFEYWTGGWNWGPRYLLPIVPLLILAAGLWVHANPTGWRRASVVALIGAGLVLNLPAALVDHSRYLVALGESDPDHYLRRAIVNMPDSPLVQQWPTVFDVASLYARDETWQAARQAAIGLVHAYQGGPQVAAISAHLLSIDDFFRLNVPDFWFVHLWLLGFPPLPVLVMVLILLGLVVVSGWQLWRGLRVSA